MQAIMLQVTMEAGKYLVEQFVVQGLVAAVALPMTVMSAANLIDTWWAVCLDRAEKAGKLLAHVLMSGAHGDRCDSLTMVSCIMSSSHVSNRAVHGMSRCVQTMV